MSRKTRALRVFLYQNKNPTIKEAWDAAWKRAQKVFHARSMQNLEEKLAATQAELEKLKSYYKNGIECFANPCREHSGENTPIFSEFFEKYGGKCVICLVNENKTLKAEIEALQAKTQITLGVGNGSGNLFVYGDYGSIKRVQQMMFERDELRAKLAALKAGDK